MVSRAQTWLLLAGVVIGLALAGTGLVRHPGRGLPAGAVARVGDAFITDEQYAAVLSDLARDSRAPLTDADRRHALDRLIDEELLIQRGVELGLAESLPAIRKGLASAVIAQAVAGAQSEAPGEEALRALYEEDPEFFTIPARYRTRWWRVPGSGPRAHARAEALQKSLLEHAGDDEAAGSATLRVGLLPAGWLPATKLTDYLGADLWTALRGLRPGELSAPVASDGAWHVLELVDMQPAGLAAFENLRPVLETEFRRRAGDAALRDYLDWLRARGRIEVSADAQP